MANFRQVHTKIWKDEWFLDLEPEHKLFFVYLFTNERASISGIYELARRVMIFESGVSSKDIDSAFEEFNKADKAFYQDGVVWVRNLRKYHETTSPKVQKKITADVNDVRECELKDIYCKEYGIDRVLIPPFKSKSTSISNSIDGGVGEDKLTLIPLAVHVGGDHREEFEEVWERYQYYKVESREPLTKTSANSLFAKFYQWGPVYSMEALETAIYKTWKGPVEPQQSPNGQQEPAGFAPGREILKEIHSVNT